MAQEDWSRWYKREYPVQPERCFVALRPSLPSYLDGVIDFGCAAGRNLQVFAGRYRLYGVDLVPPGEIGWKVEGVTYFRSRLQDFRLDGPLDRMLCIAHGTLMYLSPDEQRAFLARLLEQGCKNFIFQEYDRRTLARDGYAEPRDLVGRFWRRRKIGHPFANPFGFEKRWYRDEIPTWLRLDPG